MVRRKRLAANRAGGTAFRTTGADACGFPGAASLRFEAVKKPNSQNRIENFSQLEAL
jgi:hypothetical protein